MRKAISSIDDFLLARVTDAEERRKARLSIRLVVLLSMLSLPMAATQFVAGQPAPAAITLLTLALFLVAIGLLRLLGSVRASSNLLVLVGFVSVLVMAVLTGGAGSAALYWLAGVPILAIALGRPVDGVAWGGLAVVVILAFLTVDELGWSPNVQTQPWASPSVLSISQIGLIAFVVVLAATFEASREVVLRDLEQKNREVAASREKARRANRAKTHFLTRVSHELRTPLSSLLGFTEVLRDQARGSGQDAEYLGIIHESGLHLKDLVDDLLDLRRIEQGNMRITRTWCSVDVLVSESVRPLVREAETRGGRIEVEIDPRAPRRFLTDRTRLRQILTHLLDDGLRSTPEGGQIGLTVGAVPGVPGSLVLEVMHDGVGISQDAIGAAPLEPYQSGVDRGTAASSGLGLLTAKAIAEGLGGTVEVESKKDLGVRVRCCLWPVSEAAEAPPLADVSDSSEAALCGRRVLVADDNRTTRLLLDVLLTQAGAEVELVSDGRVAVAATLAARETERPFAVLILDVEMPDLDGLAAIRELRAAEYEGPAIALTAAAMPEDRERCLAAGFNAFATKPIDRASLLSLVASVLREQPPAD